MLNFFFDLLIDFKRFMSAPTFFLKKITTIRVRPRAFVMATLELFIAIIINILIVVVMVIIRTVFVFNPPEV